MTVPGAMGSGAELANGPAAMKTWLKPILILSWLVLAAPEPGFALVLDRDTVWRGRVRVVEEVQVAAHATLLIEPGARIEFAPADGLEDQPPVRLKVLGKLIAQGTAEAPIVFTSAAVKPAPGDWGGLIFESSDETAISRLRYCRIEYTETAIDGGLGKLVVEDAELTRNRLALCARKKFSGGMFNVALLDNDNGCRFLQNSRFSLENCRIVRSQRDSILCDKNSSPDIGNCEIISGGAAGIRCLSGSSPRIEGCLIQGNRTGLHLEMKSDPQVHNSDILENGTGIHAEKLVAPLFVGSRIVGNETGLFCNLSASVRLRDCHLEENRKFTVVVGDKQSQVVDALLPDALERRQRRLQSAEDRSENGGRQALGESGEILLDLRDNWWGGAATERVRALDGPGNLELFDDGHDRPEVEYQGRRYPRDKVLYSPWLESVPRELGRPRKAYAGISGGVEVAGGALAGARVHVFRDAADDLRGEGFSFSAPTTGDGKFSLNLAPGRYWLALKKTREGLPQTVPEMGDLFHPYGGNPVTVAPGAMTEVFLRDGDNR